MKTVKIVLGIVIALSLAFFAMGIIVQEIDHTSKVTINKPVEEVFKLLSNQEQWSEWIPEITAIKTVTTSAEVKGNSYAITVKNQDQEIALEERVLAFEPNKNLKLLFQGGGLVKIDDYNFHSVNGTTEIVVDTKTRSESFILGCMLPLVKGKLAQESQQYLNNFKEFAEK